MHRFSYVFMCVHPHWSPWDRTNWSPWFKKSDSQIAGTNLSLFNLPYLSLAQEGEGSLADSINLQELMCCFGTQLWAASSVSMAAMSLQDLRFILSFWQAPSLICITSWAIPPQHIRDHGPPGVLGQVVSKKHREGVNPFQICPADQYHSIRTFHPCLSAA